MRCARAGGRHAPGALPHLSERGSSRPPMARRAVLAGGSERMIGSSWTRRVRRSRSSAYSSSGALANPSPRGVREGCTAPHRARPAAPNLPVGRLGRGTEVAYKGRCLEAGAHLRGDSLRAPRHDAWPVIAAGRSHRHRGTDPRAGLGRGTGSRAVVPKLPAALNQARPPELAGLPKLAHYEVRCWNPLIKSTTAGRGSRDQGLNE